MTVNGLALRKVVRPENISARFLGLTALASLGAVLLAVFQAWPLWAVVAAGIAPLVPMFGLEVAWTRANYGWLALFYVLFIAQSGHMIEHVVQMVQIHLLGLQGPAARGVFGMLDIEWVHFVWNSWVFVALSLLVWRFPYNRWLWVTLAVAVWHQVEHSYILSVYLETGVAGAPGLLAKGGRIAGGLPLARPDLHFFYNLIETVPLLAAFAQQLRRAERAGAH